MVAGHPLLLQFFFKKSPWHQICKCPDTVSFIVSLLCPDTVSFAMLSGWPRDLARVLLLCDKPVTHWEAHRWLPGARGGNVLGAEEGSIIAGLGPVRNWGSRIGSLDGMGTFLVIFSDFYLDIGSCCSSRAACWPVLVTDVPGYQGHRVLYLERGEGGSCASSSAAKCPFLS